MSHVVIAAELCKGCELCMAVCPKNCFEHADSLNAYGVYPIRLTADAQCTGCSSCAVMCPDTAIEVYRDVAEKPLSHRQEAIV